MSPDLAAVAELTDDELMELDFAAREGLTEEEDAERSCTYQEVC